MLAVQEFSHEQNEPEFRSIGCPGAEPDLRQTHRGVGRWCYPEDRDILNSISHGSGQREKKTTFGKSVIRSHRDHLNG